MIKGQKVLIANSHYDKPNRNQTGTILKVSVFPELLVATENSPQGTWVQIKDLVQ